VDDGVRIDREVLRAVVRERLGRLAADVDAKRRDAGFLEALRMMARLWRYSPFNQFLIVLQRPEARIVAARRTWESLGRRVKVGETAIQVLAPTHGRFGFLPVPVYDVRQTRGRRLARLETTLRGRSRHVQTLERAAAGLRIDVRYSRQAQGVSGSSHGRHVEVDPRVTGRERVRCLAHELAHEVLHQEERARAAARKRPAPERPHAERETEAEATAYVILTALGIEPRSPAYIAWQGGTGDAALRALGRVQRATRRILEAAGVGLELRASAARPHRYSRCNASTRSRSCVATSSGASTVASPP
jgi:hypothetical protein